MKPFFADTWYFLALLSPSDALHPKVADFANQADRPILTTGAVLLEHGDALCKGRNREVFVRFLRDFQLEKHYIYEPLNSALFNSGFRLFEVRPDKDWSLTDCISFVVMKKHRVQEALTADHHFQQAGFKALFL